jgi:hypothetical protein
VNRNIVRYQLEETAILDPLEINELRTVNAGALTTAVFRQILNDLIVYIMKQQQQHKQLQQSRDDISLLYDDFVSSVRCTMTRLHGPLATVEFGHLIDRVIVHAISANEGWSSTKSMPLIFLCTVLSLAHAAPVPERMQMLYEAIQVRNYLQCKFSSNDSFPGTTENMADGSTGASLCWTQSRVTMADVKEVVQYLQLTCQLVPEVQVIPIFEQKYPVQQYKVATAEELVEWDKLAANQSVEEGPGPETNVVMDALSASEADVDAMAHVLRSQAVCAWGECYHKKKGT